jgi:hypothetical protein
VLAAIACVLYPLWPPIIKDNLIYLVLPLLLVLLAIEAGL